jgi:mannosyltransferase OCH1-like enzyme
MIPKIIWQTHEYKYEDIPIMYRENIKTYQDLDGWDYRYNSALDRELFISKYFPEYLHLYSYIRPGIYKSDFWRYLVLYKYGGFYVDMDSRLFCNEGNDFLKSINDPNATYCAVLDPNTKFNNYAIMCSENNPIIKDVIDLVVSKCQELYNQSWEVFPDAQWIYATGPEVYASVMEKHIDQISYTYDPCKSFDHFSVSHHYQYKHPSDKKHQKNFLNGKIGTRTV